MKKWYRNLENRLAVTILLGIIHIIIFLIACSIEDQESIGFLFLTFIWYGSGIFLVLFIIFEVQIKKEKNLDTRKNIDSNENIMKNDNNVSNEIIVKDKVESLNDTIIENKNDVSKRIILENVNNNETKVKNVNSEIITEVKTTKIISDKNYGFFGEVGYSDGWYALKYKYVENLHSIQNLDKFELENNDITFHAEEDNEFDPETISVYVGEHKIGLLYKGACREIIHRCVKTGKLEVSGFIYKKDVENNKVAVMVGFWETLDVRASFTTNIIKTSRKDFNGNKREENLIFLQEGNAVFFIEDDDCAGLLVIDSYGAAELGELSVGATRKIYDDTDDLEKVIGIVEEVDYTDDDKIKVKIRIYLSSYDY